MRKGLLLGIIILTILLSECSERKITYSKTNEVPVIDFSIDEIKIAYSEYAFIIEIVSIVDSGDITIDGTRAPLPFMMKYTHYEINIIEALKGEVNTDLDMMFAGGKSTFLTDKYYDHIEDIPKVGKIYLVYTTDLVSEVVMNGNIIENECFFNFGQGSLFKLLEDYNKDLETSDQNQDIIDIVNFEIGIIEEYKDVTREDVGYKYNIIIEG